jgi:CheY-like chemotaxis protein
MTKGRDAALISIVDDSPVNIDVLSSVLSGAGPWASISARR